MTAAPQAWNVGANWSNNASFPNFAGALAVITNGITASQTIDLNQTITLGSLVLGAPNGSSAYTIAPNGGTLAFSNHGNPATWTETSSSPGDFFTAPVLLNDNLSINNASTNALNLSGAITGPGSLTLNESGAPCCWAAAIRLRRLLWRAEVLKVGSNFALGGNGGTAIAPGGTLDLNGFSLGAEPVTVSGTGVAGDRGNHQHGGDGADKCVAVFDAHGGHDAGRLGRAGTYAARAMASLRPRWARRLIRSTSPRREATGFRSPRSMLDPALGNIDIQQGTLGFEWATTSMGNPAAQLSVEMGATLAFSQSTTPWNKQFVLNGDGVTTTVSNTSGTNTIIGPMTWNGAVTLGVAGGALQFNGPVGGSGSVNKTLGGTLSLGGTNSYAGNLKVSAGTLAITSATAVTNIPSLNLTAGTVLDASAAGGGLVLSGQTLSGSGAVAGNVTVGNGGVLAPSNLSSNSFNTLTFSNSLTLGSGGTCVMSAAHTAGSNDVVKVLGTLTYGGKLSVGNPSNVVYAVGDSFKVFNAAV